MARLFARLLRVRWAVALRVARRVALELRDAHGRLEPDERARLAELVRRSGGRPQRLSRSECGEVVWLTRKAVGRLT
jgi:hypothetical protein